MRASQDGRGWLGSPPSPSPQKQLHLGEAALCEADPRKLMAICFGDRKGSRGQCPCLPASVDGFRHKSSVSPLRRLTGEAGPSSSPSSPGLTPSPSPQRPWDGTPWKHGAPASLSLCALGPPAWRAGSAGRGSHLPLARGHCGSLARGIWPAAPQDGDYTHVAITETEPGLLAAGGDRGAGQGGAL